MTAATATSQSARTRLDAPQIGEGIWNVFDAQTCCILQFSTRQGDLNGFELITATATASPRLTVQGDTPNIDLTLSGQGAGQVIINGPFEVTGNVTLDGSLLVKGSTTLQGPLTQTGGTVSFDSPTFVIDETAHKVGIGTIPIAGGAKLDVTNGYLRALNGPNIAPTAGTGVEIATFGNVGFMTATDRTGGVNVELNLTASPLKLNVLNAAAITLGGATTASSTLHVVGATALDAGLTVTGDITLTGVLRHASTGASLIIPSAAGWVVMNQAGSNNNLAVSNAGVVTIRGGLTVSAGGITIVAGDLTLANAQVKCGTDTWLLPTGLGSDTLVTLTATQALTNKTLGTGTKILLGGDATGDLYYNAGGGTLAHLPAGTTAQVLLGGGAGVAPLWNQVDRTRVVLTTPLGIMTLHDVQTKDVQQTFTSQVVCGPGGLAPGVFAHQLICCDSLPAGATFTSSQIGLYGTSVANLMLRQMNNGVETYWLANNLGVNFGVLTNHSLTLYTQNTARLTIAAGGNVTIGNAANTLFIEETNNYVGINTSTSPGAGHRLYVNGDIRWDGMTFVNPTGTAQPLQSGPTGGPTVKTVNAWLRLNLGGSLGYIPWFL